MELAQGSGIVVVIRQISRFLIDRFAERRWRETGQVAATSVAGWRPNTSRGKPMGPIRVRCLDDASPMPAVLRSLAAAAAPVLSQELAH